MRRWAPWVIVLLVAAGCGGGSADGPDADPSTPDADQRDIADRLEALDGVAVVEMVTTNPGERHFELTFTQPVDHAAPGGQSFDQNVTLVHRGTDRPMVAVTTGYWNYYGFRPYELTQLLDGNQIVIEHRFFAGSRPVPADWTKLTIRQAADDQHRIIALLATIYTRPWLTTGASKGGMTAVYHRRFYPDDVVAAVPYVAPISFAEGDPRYPGQLDAIGPPACRQALRAIQVEMLGQARWDALMTRAQQEAAIEGYVYNRIAIGPAVESAITGVEWAFWQYLGAGFCAAVPATTASGSALWGFLNDVNPPSGSVDADLERFEAYYYQAVYELGYPASGGAHLAGLTRYTDADYAGGWPVGVEYPIFRPEAMADIDQWVQSSGSRLLFLYGEWDPWTGGMFELGAATDSLRVIAPGASHAAGFLDLAASDKAAAYAKLAAWSGVTVDETPLLSKAGARIGERVVPQLRIPPAFVRMQQLRRR